jgi:hypothetical protein
VRQFFFFFVFVFVSRFLVTKSAKTQETGFAAKQGDRIGRNFVRWVIVYIG